MNNIICGDALQELQKLESDSIDLIVTDPPYGYSFMHKDWDKAVVGVDTWKECLRVLKAGAFAFIMSSPRQDVLAKMVVNLIDAGFETNFTSIYWTYASGFPKAADVSKLIDKRNGRTQDTYQPFAAYLKQRREEKGLSQKQIDDILGTNTAYSWWEGRLSGIQLPTKQFYLQLKEILELDNRFDELIKREEAEREILTQKKKARSEGQDYALPTTGRTTKYVNIDITKPATDQAKALEGAYCGFQPKPAVEVVLVVMKPLSEKSYVDQALTNGHGITWLDDCRIPYQSDDIPNEEIRFSATGIPHAEKDGGRPWIEERIKNNLPIKEYTPDQKGRFPANLLVSDDVLNDGKITKGSQSLKRKAGANKYSNTYDNAQRLKPWLCSRDVPGGFNDSGSFSRYFDLDKWFDTTFPFLITPKASKSEKNMGLDKWMPQTVNDGRQTPIDNPFQRGETPRNNIHPTVKPIKLLSYLITLGSRPNDIILDPFCGSGTTCIAAKMLKRRYLGIELNQEYVDIANARLAALKDDEQPALFEMVTS